MEFSGIGCGPAKCKFQLFNCVKNVRQSGAVQVLSVGPVSKTSSARSAASPLAVIWNILRAAKKSPIVVTYVVSERASKFPHSHNVPVRTRSLRNRRPAVLLKCRANAVEI